MGKRLRAGTAITDISPRKGIELAGYPHCPRYNTGIHDPLFASCICLDDGVTKLAIVTMDLLFYSKKYVTDIRRRITDATGIKSTHIMFCCSHTHSGPWAAGRLDLEALEKGLKPDASYIAELQDKLCNLVISANQNMFDAKAGAGKGFCGREHGVGGNRRDPDGPSDGSVCVLGIQDDAGIWKGCLTGYALHPTVIHSESTVVTADYPGYIRKYLSRVKPDMVMLFAQGTSGNQSTRYFRSGQTFDEACRIGTAIGIEVDRVLEKIYLDSDIRLFAESVETDLDLRVYPDKSTAQKNVETAEEKLEQMKKSGASYVDVRNAELRLLGAEDILGYIILKENGTVPDLLADELPSEIQVLGIGDAVMVGLQGELFVEFGLEIKKKSPFENTFVFELANGAAPGYVYTKDALETGGYETDTSMLAENCGQKLVDTATRLLMEAYKKGEGLK